MMVLLLRGQYDDPVSAVCDDPVTVVYDDPV